MLSCMLTEGYQKTEHIFDRKYHLSSPRSNFDFGAPTTKTHFEKMIGMASKCVYVNEIIHGNRNNLEKPLKKVLKTEKAIKKFLQIRGYEF